MGLSTHVLDQVLGAPAAGVAINVHQDEVRIFEAVTDADGRCSDLLGGRPLQAGSYRLVFDCGPYFEAAGRDAFYYAIPIDFMVTDTTRHYHVPLLLAPFGYATYRGS